MAFRLEFLPDVTQIRTEDTEPARLRMHGASAKHPEKADGLEGLH